MRYFYINLIAISALCSVNCNSFEDFAKLSKKHKLIISTGDSSGMFDLLCNKTDNHKSYVNQVFMVYLTEYLVSSNLKALMDETNITPDKYIQINSYVLNQLTKSNYTGIIKSKIEEICLESKPLPQTKTTKPIYDLECYKTAVVSSTAIGSVAGCAAGAATGTFIFPVVGTITGCVAGLIGVGITSMLASKAIAKSAC